MGIDGYTLLFELREALNETSASAFMNDRVSYGYLWDAALKINLNIAALTSTQTISALTSTSIYNLNPDYMGLYMRDFQKNLFIKYNDGSSDTFITFQTYEELYYQNNSTATSIPWRFSLKDITSAISNITGTASAIGTVSDGEATLTDTSSASKFSTVNPGDIIHNTTSGYHGMVIAKISETALITAIFNADGDAQSWAASDYYIIIPQGRFALVIDPPSSTASHTITVPYIKKPVPVFSPYRSYDFPFECKEALVQYAVFKYKYRDREPSFGDKFMQWFGQEVGQERKAMRKAVNRGGFTMNMKGNR
jgi:hypothetical protein